VRCGNLSRKEAWFTSLVTVGSANKNAQVKEIMLAIFLDFRLDVGFSFF
jgi:hypothetical protein